jgi:hypothetical protein
MIYRKHIFVNNNILFQPLIEVLYILLTLLTILQL